MQVGDTADVNHAAAVLAAAEHYFPEEKAWAKMSTAEKQAKLARDQQKQELEAKAKREKDERENPTVDENGEHIQTVAEAKIEAA